MNNFNYLTSEISWCEPNFEHNQYIAEYWNTLSSFVISFIGVYGLFYRQNLKLLYFLMIPIGLTSALFHGTLSLYGQLLDELSILVILTASLYYYKAISLKIVVLNCLQMFLLFKYPIYNRLMLFCYGFACFKILRDNRHKINKGTYKKGTYLFFFSVTCWLIDMFLCSYIGHIYLHAIWHIAIGLTAYYGIQCIEDFVSNVN